MLTSQKKRNDKKCEYLFDGLLRCAECRHNISVRARDKNGKAYTVCNFYRRFKKEYRTCTPHGGNYDKLEKGLINTIKEILVRVNTIDVVKKVANGYDDNSTIEGNKKK